MEMVSIPLGQYEEFLSMRLELHLIYTKCRKEGAYAAGTFTEDMMKMLHPAQCPEMPMKVPEVMPDA